MGNIADKLSYLAGTKSAIKEAIEAKGVEVPEGVSFRGYVALIEGISGTGASLTKVNATATGISGAGSRTGQSEIDLTILADTSASAFQ